MSKSKGKTNFSAPSWLSKARDKWQFTGRERPPFAEKPKENQVSVWDFPRPPALAQVQEEVHVFTGKICLAKSNETLAVCETASPPTYYVPSQDVKLGLLVKIPRKKSICEWKGSAAYWALKTSPDKAIGWSYKNPFSPFEALKDYIAFYPQTLDCFVGDEKVRPQPGEFYAGWITDSLAGPFKGEPGTGHW
jgi:uncharacterized protein (DUF427 family)